MNKHHQLEEGTLLKYIGKGFENFNKEQPLMKFLGYDSYGWQELWVDYNGQRIHVEITEVELALR
jgi:hypothetical protein